MALYVKGMGNISPQKTWGDDALLMETNNAINNKFTAIEPEYTAFIDPKLIRRMSRIIKMGVASASMALKQANVSVPDAIITATGYGCLEDTGTFLTKMVENKEQALNPTPFIQSTHNTIGSQIALMLQCQGYNQTYAHGAFSFESVLLDALLQAEENPSQLTLIGGVDEITLVSHAIQSRFGIFKNGYANGEGSAFFSVSGTPAKKDIARIDRVATFYKPDHETLVAGVRKFVTESGAKLDCVLSGGLPDELRDLFNGVPVVDYKNLCGEYPVSTAFATWLAAHILKQRIFPSALMPPTTSDNQSVNTFLILNSYFGTHYSLILMKAC